ncbi:predicted protein [Plenodomus lingam JN3]|uniref:Predicted protein n=1 Tax=Leptosphaeria maculans (strain JN3 / isolate v23.1.3 / race Av1-4-5-6-7-8) TaxID=985895 RepID=E4ZS42_LEPMJ|nr:predicted protein [Plenodomus lingam JN3]CBX94222.1 predicted protein [Plenodomus lingam JN3]
MSGPMQMQQATARCVAVVANGKMEWRLGLPCNPVGWTEMAGLGSGWEGFGSGLG